LAQKLFFVVDQVLMEKSWGHSLTISLIDLLLIWKENTNEEGETDRQMEKFDTHCTLTKVKCTKRDMTTY